MLRTRLIAWVLCLAPVVACGRVGFDPLEAAPPGIEADASLIDASRPPDATSATDATAADDGAAPLGSISGTFDGAAFTPRFGVARPKTTGDFPSSRDHFVVLATEAIECSTLVGLTDVTPGVVAILQLTSIEVGAFSEVPVALASIDGGGGRTGGATGPVEITTVTETTVMGSVDISDPSRGDSLTGTFEVVHCP